MEKIGTQRRYGFHLGDNIKIQTRSTKQIVKSYIWALTDTTVTIGPRTTIPASDVGAVYKNFHFPKLMTKFFFIGGAGYLVLDSFNNLINKERVFRSQTLIISGCLMGFSLAIIPLHQWKYKIGIRWKFKIMDINLN
ncbi:MAG: hypothetical protein ABSD71_10235 [Bacteroidales bacterium]